MEHCRHPAGMVLSGCGCGGGGYDVARACLAVDGLGWEDARVARVDSTSLKLKRFDTRILLGSSRGLEGRIVTVTGWSSALQPPYQVECWRGGTEDEKIRRRGYRGRRDE